MSPTSHLASSPFTHHVVLSASMIYTAGEGFIGGVEATFFGTAR